MKHEESRKRRATIVRLAEQGVDDWIIAMALELSPITVQKARTSGGVIRPSGRPAKVRPAAPPPKRPHDPRLIRLKHLVAARCTLEEIAAEFGVSRERVRQLCNKRGLTRKAPVPQLTRHHSLADEGLRRCTTCHEAKPLDEMHKSNQFHCGYGTRCKACGCERIKTAYAIGTQKEYLRAYRQTERGKEVSRRAVAKYNAKKKAEKGA